jgi:hypothetical protein
MFESLQRRRFIHCVASKSWHAVTQVIVFPMRDPKNVAQLPQMPVAHLTKWHSMYFRQTSNKVAFDVFQTDIRNVQEKHTQRDHLTRMVLINPCHSNLMVSAAPSRGAHFYTVYGKMTQFVSCRNPTNVQELVCRQLGARGDLATLRMDSASRSLIRL